MLIKLGQNIVKPALIAWKSVENVRLKKKEKRKIMKRKIMMKILITFIIISLSKARLAGGLKNCRTKP